MNNVQAFIDAVYLRDIAYILSTEGAREHMTLYKDYCVDVVSWYGEAIMVITHSMENVLPSSEREKHSCRTCGSKTTTANALLR